MINRQNIEDVFDDCLNRLQNGQDIETILRLYPEHSQRLRPLLELSQATGRLISIPPQEVRIAQDRARFRLIQAMEKPAPPITQSRGVTRLLSRVAVVLLFGFVVTLLLAQNTLPGDTLYGMKQFTQNIRGAFGTDIDTIEQERLTDIQAVIDEGRIALVSFTGTINAIEGDVLLIDGLKVRPPSGTENTLFVGAVVEVNGITTSDGFIAAGEIIVIVPAEPTPTPITTATLAATATASVTPTAEPTLTATATITQVTPSATATLTATATITQTTPSATTPPPTAPNTPTTEAQASGQCVPQRPDGWVSYTVRSGDTISVLAIASDTSIDDLREVNCLETTAFIVVGQLLFLENTPQFNNNTGSNDDSSGSDDNSGSSENSGSNNDDDDDDGDDDDNSGSSSDDDDFDDSDDDDDIDDIDDPDD